MSKLFEREPEPLKTKGPEELLFLWGLLLTITALLFVKSFFTAERRLLKDCTAVAPGTVISVNRIVSHRQESTGDVFFHYTAVVKPDNEALFGGKTLGSKQASHQYVEGERLNIHYDPDNPAKYYIDFAEPSDERGVAGYGFAVMLIIFTVTLVKAVRGR